MANLRTNFTIRFSDNAFEKARDPALSDKLRKYTKRVAEFNKKAEALDRYDKFSELTIDGDSYERAASGEGAEYGIERSLELHAGGSVIFDHQRGATKKFLKELRGFGLLADVVGSGKTYEACSVLSELAVRGEISTMLAVVPSQVYATWKTVLEESFGLGKGVLYEVTPESEAQICLCGTAADATSRAKNLFDRDRQNGMLIPKRPWIVRDEDFVQWRETALRDLLFDVIVVDEAHNLCNEEGEYARAMKLLAVLTETKRRAEKTYCLLLSATPHSGNLAHMFRLWYFIRCKGGELSDFDEKDDSERTLSYRNEKSYYKNQICHGASTVMEFIKKVKIEKITNPEGEFYAEFDRFLRTEKQERIDRFSELLEGEQFDRINEFLETRPEADRRVKDGIASAYHNGVLRSIMIRQPNRLMRKEKNIVNLMFYPASDRGQRYVTVQGLDNREITVDLERMNGDVVFDGAGKMRVVGGEGAITDADGTSYTLIDYLDAFPESGRARNLAQLMFRDGILKRTGMTDELFEKKNSVKFYWDQMRNARSGITTQFKPVYEGERELDFKLREFFRILANHADRRVLVFFDYDLKRDERVYEDVFKAMRERPEFASRLIEGNAVKKDEKEAQFNERADAVLVVTDSAFTEGSNLQACNIIVNFQVTPNPLAMEQRIGRIFRLGQKNNVIVYSLADMRRLEGYVLSYFSSIGLMSSNSGDAAIIAGCNNDNMVTVRCAACGKVKLLSAQDYAVAQKTDADILYCAATAQCRQESKRGTRMAEINSKVCKCDRCGAVIKRADSESGGMFECMSANNAMKRGILCNLGERGDRELYCRKICAISHCLKFTEGEMKGRCKALAHYLENPNTDDAALMYLCEECDYRRRDECPSKCRVGTGPQAVRACSDCARADCRPRPHSVRFDEKWEAQCPECGGRIRPVEIRTFETFIRTSFERRDDDGFFCENFENETRKVREIQEILSNDRTEDER